MFARVLAHPHVYGAIKFRHFKVSATPRRRLVGIAMQGCMLQFGTNFIMPLIIIGVILAAVHASVNTFDKRTYYI